MTEGRCPPLLARTSPAEDIGPRAVTGSRTGVRILHAHATIPSFGNGLGVSLVLEEDGIPGVSVSVAPAKGIDLGCPHRGDGDRNRFYPPRDGPRGGRRSRAAFSPERSDSGPAGCCGRLHRPGIVPPPQPTQRPVEVAPLPPCPPRRQARRSGRFGHRLRPPRSTSPAHPKTTAC